MKTVVRLTIALMAALPLFWASSAYAADNGTEFGIEDDLTVLGTEGTATDPDLEVKGFSVFGATQSAPALNIPVGPGNVFVNGYMQVSSGIYMTGSSTFTGHVKLPAATSIYMDAGTAGQVIKRNADGQLYWAVDNEGGAGTMNGTPLRLMMIEADGVGIAPSLFLQNADAGTNITMIAGSSMTILGDGTDGLGVSGATKLDGALSVTGNSSLTGDLGVSGAASIGGALSVDDAAYFGAGAAKSSFTALGALDMAADADITLSGSAQIVLPNLPLAGTDGANKTYVDERVRTAGPWTRDDAANVVKLSTITDSVGIGVAIPAAKLHVSSVNALAGDDLVIVSTGTLPGDEVFAINGAGDVFAKGDSQHGSSVDNVHGFNKAPESDTALAVAGSSASGDYAAKFYSGASLAAWIKKK